MAGERCAEVSSHWTNPRSSERITPFGVPGASRGPGHFRSLSRDPFIIVHDILVALSLVFIIEGIWPFLSPGGFRRLLAMVALESERSLRLAGFVSMISGLGLLYLVN